MNREECKERARMHEQFIMNVYPDETADSILRTVVYNDSNVPEPGTSFSSKYETEIILINTDTVSAFNSLKEDDIMVLNFASYKHPGGGYIKGMMAQEESLCHNSNLYQVLSSFERSYYAWNNLHLNGGFYLNRALYSPGIVMGNGKCNVLTCAAPNASRMKRYKTREEEKNRLALVSRVLFLLNIAAVNKQETLILGAYGCGVFKQNPEEVAKLFWYCLNNTHKGVFKRVIFAIPDETSTNYVNFKKYLGSNVKEELWPDTCTL